MIIKNLWRRKTRTLLTLLGIAVGVGAVVSLTAFGEGLASGMQLTFSAPEADLTVGQRDAMMLFLSAVDEEVGDEINATVKVRANIGGQEQTVDQLAQSNATILDATGLAVLSLFVPIVGFISIYNTGNRIRQAQATSGGAPEASGLLGILGSIVLALNVPYYSAQLNRVWHA